MSSMQWQKRDACYIDINEYLQKGPVTLKINEQVMTALEKIDSVYRSLCGILYNYVPTSGHPGGSISSGRIVHALFYQTMDYDFSKPYDDANDYLCYAAGHKAMGLYAALALRNECLRVTNEKQLPVTRLQVRLEDLLGFRRNPTQETPLFAKFAAKTLDGHPTPLTPFVRMATGASGVGVTTAVGYAFGAVDWFGAERAPKVHILDGEGGLTPGRVQEVMAAAATNHLENIILHVDWNQSSIDSDRVCRENGESGEYVQWDPRELAYVNNWNVIFVDDGTDYSKILVAQDLAKQGFGNHLPTAIIYRTTKGWRYGIEGRKSHGAGHDFCSDNFYNFLSHFEGEFSERFARFRGERTAENIENYFYDNLLTIRRVLEKRAADVTVLLGQQVLKAQAQLQLSARCPRHEEPVIERLFSNWPSDLPRELQLKAGEQVTLRGVLANVLAYLNRQSRGAIVGTSADLFGSTNMSDIAKGVAEGFYDAQKNPSARLVKIGGICEDAMGGFMAGLSSFGRHVGVGSSYGAFIAALQHITARLHAIGQEAYHVATNTPANPFIIMCGHAGPKTGEDGPTHADPQALQLFCDNFPKGSVVTLTPMEPQEIWPLLTAALNAHPAVIVPYISRPSEKVIDREALRLPSAALAANGVYALREANQKAKKYHGTLVLQGNSVAESFIRDVLPRIDQNGLNMNLYYVASTELFDRLPAEQQEAIFPARRTHEAMAITEFTLATLYRFVTSSSGREHSLYTFKKGHYLGSGQADRVLKEAGLDGESQWAAVEAFARMMEKR